MDLEKIELHPLTKLIVYLAVPVFAWVVLSNMYRTFANPISSKQAIQEMSDEFKHIELPKDARVIEKSSANKGTQVWVGATYASGLEIKTIESDYTKSLLKNGWVILGESAYGSGSYEYRIEFCKKQYVASLSFSREKPPTYTFDLVWNKNRSHPCQ